jgi:DNA invertase Pin-like site-specific DNA recombinase
MAKYFAIRVSSKDQNFARQLSVAEQYGIPKENIFCDKITGRKKDRPEYDRMKKLLQKGDEVFFTELDRIGRAKYLIKEELDWFKENGIIVRVLNVPTTLVEFPQDQKWLMEMVSNILIEVMSTVAELEWAERKKRCDDGIAAMPTDESGKKISSKTGRGFGRPASDVSVVLLDGETIDEACARLGISRATYYRKLAAVK